MALCKICSKQSEKVVNFTYKEGCVCLDCMARINYANDLYEVYSDLISTKYADHYKRFVTMEDKSTFQLGMVLQAFKDDVFISRESLGVVSVGNYAKRVREAGEKRDFEYSDDYKFESASSAIGAGLKSPKCIYDGLSEYVIGHEEAKKKLSVAAYSHMLRCGGAKIEKSNVLLVGGTGVGKTYMVSVLAKLLDVPFVSVNATSFTEAGYKGDDVEEIGRKLLKAANNNVTAAQNGIVFIDEIDKITSSFGTSANSGKDVNGRGVQQALLKVIEGCVLSIGPSHGAGVGAMFGESRELDTKNILFICAGAFDGLQPIVQKRIGTTSKSIGFGGSVEKADEVPLMGNVLPQDFVEFGMMSEFMGRLPVITVLDELTKEVLYDILTKPKNSLLSQYENLFECMGIKLEMKEGALKAVVEKAMLLKVGSRSLRSIMEEALYMSVFNCVDTAVKKVVVTRDSILAGVPPILCENVNTVVDKD